MGCEVCVFSQKKNKKSDIVVIVGWAFEFVNNHWIQFFSIFHNQKTISSNYFKNLKEPMVFTKELAKEWGSFVGIYLNIFFSKIF
jgi:desulfoferrodoxin (superoxide reductase-like protein)